jgi:hypothetical protein
MNAGVGPTRALGIDVRSEEILGGGDQGSLDAQGVLLHLPAAVTGSVVFDRQSVRMGGMSHRFPPAFPAGRILK